MAEDEAKKNNIVLPSATDPSQKLKGKKQTNKQTKQKQLLVGKHQICSGFLFFFFLLEKK